MRFLFVALLVLELISVASGQWQAMPVPSVAGHPFSADQVTPRTLSPNLNSAVPTTPAFIGTRREGPELTFRFHATRRPFRSS